MAPKQKNVFDWITPISSSQSSPASSIYSVNDREVEMTMDKSACPTPGLTPSPSPTLSDILDCVGSQVEDNNDSYIESLSSFFDEISEAPTPTLALYTNEEKTNTVSELNNSQHATVTKLQTQPLPEAATPVRKPLKRTNDDRESDEPLSKSLKSTPSSMAAWNNIELPKKKSVSKKPQPSRVRKSRAISSSNESSSNESASTSTPIPQRVAINVNEEGNPVITIALAPPETPRTQSSTKKLKATDGRTRGCSKTKNPPKASTSKPAEKKTKKDRFCVQSLVEKFIQAAKNKKVPTSKAP